MTPKDLKEDKDDEAIDDESNKEAYKEKKNNSQEKVLKITPLNTVPVVYDRYGMDVPEDKLEKGFWKCLRIIRVHCLNLESMDVYLLSDRKYALSAEIVGKKIDGETSRHLESIGNVVGNEMKARIEVEMDNTAVTNSCCKDWKLLFFNVDACFVAADYLVSAVVPADSSSSIPADYVPAGSSSSIPADYVSAGHVLVSADCYL
ncbi:hypothetical protein Tco_0777066 [Tanacetum coccineum]